MITILNYTWHLLPGIICGFHHLTVTLFCKWNRVLHLLHSLSTNNNLEIYNIVIWNSSLIVDFNVKYSDLFFTTRQRSCDKVIFSVMSVGLSTGIRVCSQCPTPRPIQTATKNGLHRIVWRCSHCTDTDTDTDYYCNQLNQFLSVSVSESVSVLVSVSGSVNAPLVDKRMCLPF